MRPRGSAVSLEKRRLRAMEFLKQGMGVREIRVGSEWPLDRYPAGRKKWNAKGEAGLKSKLASGRPKKRSARRGRSGKG